MIIHCNKHKTSYVIREKIKEKTFASFIKRIISLIKEHDYNKHYKYTKQFERIKRRLCPKSFVGCDCIKTCFFESEFINRRGISFKNAKKM